MPTSMFGVLGWPVGHSASPAMMNTVFRDLGLDAYYGAFAVRPEAIDTAVRGIGALGMRGVNVTIPHKQAVMPFCDTLTEAAQLAQAVNTLRFHPETGGIDGHNTDIVGWWRSIEPCLTGSPKQWVVLGGGGAARAIVAALTLYAPNSRVTLAARRPEQRISFERDFGGTIDFRGVDWSERHGACGEADVIVNTTPMGMWPNVDDSPIEDTTCLRAGQVVQDIVYRPLETRLLRDAAAAGATVQDGLWMLVFQGVAAVEFWLNATPSGDVMRDAALRFLQA